MVGVRLADLRQKVAILDDLAREECAISGHAVTMRVQLQVDPLVDQLTQLLWFHQVQDPIRPHRSQIDLQSGS